MFLEKRKGKHELKQKYDDNRRKERNDTREGDFIFGFEKRRRVLWCDENQKQRSWKSADQKEATFKIEKENQWRRR